MDASLKPAAVSRVVAIDHVKAVAIIAVILHHCWGWNGQIAAKYYWLTQWCVLAFLYCSGYLEALRRTVGMDRTYVLNLFRRLVLPFLTIGLVMIGVRQLAERWLPNMGDSRFSASFAGKLWDHVTLRVPTVALPLYFLVLLFFIKLVFGSWRALMARDGSRVWIHLTPFLFLMVVAGWHLLLGSPRLTGWGTTAGWSLTWPALFCYSWGFMVAASSQAVIRRMSLLLVLFILTLAVVLQSTTFLFLCVPFLCHGFVKLAVKGLPVISFPLSFLAYYSGTIFAWHTPFVLNTSLKAALRLNVNEFVTLALAITLTVVGCCVIHVVLFRVSILRWLRV